MEFQVNLAMTLEMDNNVVVDVLIIYSVDGRTRHMEKRQYYLKSWVSWQLKVAIEVIESNSLD